MSQVDNRVVEMQFKNQQFESGIKNSVDSLAQLKKSLNMGEAARGLDELQRAGNKFSLEGIGDGVDRVAQRFSTLGIIGMTVLQRLTNSAIDSGKRMVMALSFDQLAAGMSKYEQKTASVQAIMNATGKELAEVNTYLDELMWFSDETSYGFSDMTAALAQMTSSGGDIDNLIPLITGVANATAYAGKGAAEFSRVMFNLNQSYGAGNLQYMDWRSIELAGVASKELKQVFIDTAKEMGVLNKQGKTAKGTLVDIGSFGSTLSEKWANVKVMEKAFGKFSELSQAAYKLVEAGEYDTASEAMEFLAGKYSEIAEKGFKAAQQAKSFSEAIAATKDAVSSGWMRTAEIIFGDYHEAVELWSEVTGGLWELFASGATARNEMLQAWKELGGRVDLIDSLKDIVNFLDTIRRTIGDAFRDVFPAMTAERLYEITTAIKDFTSRLTLAEGTIDKLRRVFRGIFSIFKILGQFIAGFKLIDNVVLVKLFQGGGLLEFLAKVGDRITEFSDKLSDSKFIFNALTKIGEATEWLVGAMSGSFAKVKEFFGDFKSPDISGISEFFDALKSGLSETESFLDPVKSRLGWLIDFFKTLVTGAWNLAKRFAGAFKSISDRIGDTFGGASFDKVFDVINGLLSAGLALQFVYLTQAMSGIAEGLASIGWVLEAYQANLRAKTIMTIAIAIAILAASLMVMSMIDSTKLSAAIVAMGALMAELFTSMAIFQKFTIGTGMMGTATSMVILSVALLLLSTAMLRLSKLDPEQIAGGVIAIGLLVSTLVVAAKVLSANQGALITGAGSFILFAVAILVLTSAVKKLSELDADNMSRGIVALAILMAQLAIFVKIVKGSSLGAGQAIGFIALAIALSIMAKAVTRFSKMDAKDLQKGVMTLGFVLVMIGTFLRLMPDGKKIFGAAASMVLIGIAMMILAKAVQMFGRLNPWELWAGLAGLGGALLIITLALNNMPADAIPKSVGLLILATALLLLGRTLERLGGMSWEQVAKSLVVLGGALGIIVVAMQKMTLGVQGAAALLVVSLSLAVLASVLKILGAMSLGEIAKSLLTLVGVLVIMGVAAIVLGPITPILLSLAGAIFLFGLAALAAGAGLLLFATALSALAISGAAGITALVMVITSIIGLIPVFFEGIGFGILAIATVIAEGAPIIAEMVKSLLLSVFDVIKKTVPELVSTAILVVKTFLEGIVELVPIVVNAGLQILIGFLTGIRDNMYELVVVGVDVMLEFLAGINSRMGDIVDMGFQMLISFINGLADAVRNNSKAIFDACLNLIMAFVDAFKSFITDFILPLGGEIVDGLVQGIKDTGKGIKDAAIGMGRTVVDGFKDFLGIKSPSTVYEGFGRNIGIGLMDGMSRMSDQVGESAGGVGGSAMDALKKSLSTVSDILETDTDLTPMIRPVLDMGTIEKDLQEVFKTQPTVGVNPMKNYQVATAIAGGGGTTSLKIDMGRYLDDLKGLVQEVAESSKVNLSGSLSVQVKNDKGEIIGIAKTTVMDLLRRESRF